MITKSIDIQNSFLQFFNDLQHQVVAGSSIIPDQSDKTLLFINAGMNQFKDYFLQTIPAPYESAVSAQRCVRAGGKHNDLDQVGFTARHLTSFTMLGNFSFGCYFKEQAIYYAWQYLTEIVKIEKEKLWVTVFESDDEAFSIWRDKIKVPEYKIIRLGEKDNFWQMGDVGPCGPCSEIYYDRGIQSQLDEDSLPGDDKSIRFMEIWNLVFMQYERQIDKSLLPLKQVGIDTGMGLERLASVLQSKESVFQTDLFMPLLIFIEQETGKKYLSDLKTAFQVLVDHIKTVSLLIYYGVLPSNEGRGYVLRKIIRRALLFSKKISQNPLLFASLITPLVGSPDLLFLDLKNKKDFIYGIIVEESEKFFHNLTIGLSLFSDLVKKQTSLLFSGKSAFLLYDTYGFPLEITKILTFEKGMEVDLIAYELEMKMQQERSQKNQKFKSYQKNIFPLTQTTFLGYESLECVGIVQEIFVGDVSVEDISIGEEAVFIFDQTVFYPTGGGQVADKGVLFFNNTEMLVLGVEKYVNAIGVRVLSAGSIRVGCQIKQTVYLKTRLEVSRHHSAVHILYKALQKYFNDDALRQDGSFVCDSYFTLDITMKHDCTYEDIKKIEQLVNNDINAAVSISWQYMALAEAKAQGATADFGQKYNPEKVRVVSIDAITKDLCGGCHAKNTRELQFFILKEVVSQGSGIKRFTGLVGQAAYNYFHLLESTVINLKSQLSSPIDKIQDFILKKDLIIKDNQKYITLLKEELLVKEAKMISSFDKEKIIIKEISHLLSGYEEKLLKHLQSLYSCVLLYSRKEEEKAFLVGYFNENDLGKIALEKIHEQLKNNFKFVGKMTNDGLKGMILLPQNRLLYFT